MLFPQSQAKVIMKDIFEDLYKSKDEEEFDRLLNDLRDQWLAIEVKYTRNEPPGKFVAYFDEHKTRSMKLKMLKVARVQKYYVMQVHYQIILKHTPNLTKRLLQLITDQ